jgi:Ca2+-binding EF-hand superfamily protein
VREISDIKNELNKHRDFSVYDMFQMIKTNTSSISTEAIGLFLIANNFQLNDNELKIIVQKLDIDKNGYVTIEDLEMFFGNKERYFGDDSTLLPKKQILQTEEIPINGNNKLLKNGQTNFSNNKNDNNSHINIEQLSPNLAMRSYPERQLEIEKPFYPYKENPFSNTNSCPKSNPFLNITNLPHYSNIELITSYLKLLMDIELKIENLKIELAIRADFNIEDAFRLFEHTNPNFITEPDLKKGLNILGIYPKSEEILLLMNKYSLSGQNVLNFSDLFDMLTPFTREYRSEIEHRKASPYSTKFNKANIFLTTTKICIVNLFKFIIGAENLIEKERKKINKIFNINIQTAFKMIDKSQCGAFSILDLNLFLKENGVSYIPKELNLLFIRLDRSREGKIGLKAFVTETFPKLPN